MKKTVRILTFTLVFVMLALTLASCGEPKSKPADAVSALKKNDYTAVQDTLIVPTALALLGVKCDSVVTGSKTVEDKNGDKKVESVTIVYFTDKDAATTAWEKVKSYAEDTNKDAKDNKDDFQIKQSGAMIYWGTKAGIKAAS